MISTNAEISQNTETENSSKGYLQPVVLSHRPLIRAFRGDCMDWMQATADKAYDLAIVDPPYGIGRDGQKANVKFNFIEHKQKDWDKDIPPKEYFEELRRVSKNQIIWGGNYFTDNIYPTPCWIIWDKMQEFSGAVFEMAWTSFDSPAKAFRMSRVEAYTHQMKIHPTQKPEKLYRWILSNFAKAGQRILDTHGGSFSSAVACHTEGFEMDICEIDKEYFDAGIKRFKDATCQLKMF